MTSQEFDKQKHKLRTLSAQTNELAQLILVDGLNKTDAAKAVGMSRQNVNKTMNRVMALLRDLPSDYVYLQEWMPESLAIETRAKIKAARKEK